MIDFRQSIQQGLGAYQEQNRSREEITEILQELASQMLASTNNKVGVKLANVDVSISEMLELAITGEGTAIVAFPTEFPDITRRLSLIRIPLSGYPVTLKWGREKVVCGDNSGLVEALANMLALPTTGRVIAELAEYVPGAADF